MGVLKNGVQNALQVVASVVDQVEDDILLQGLQVSELLSEDLLDLVQVLTISRVDVGDIGQELQELAALQQLSVWGTQELATIDGRWDNSGGWHNLQGLQLLLKSAWHNGRHNGLLDERWLLDLAQDVRDVSLALVEVELEELAVLSEDWLRLAELVNNDVLLIEVLLDVWDEALWDKDTASLDTLGTLDRGGHHWGPALDTSGVDTDDLDATANDAGGEWLEDDWEDIWSLNATNNSSEGWQRDGLDHLGDELLHVVVSERIDTDHSDAGWQDEAAANSASLLESVQLEHGIQEWDPLASPQELSAGALQIGLQQWLELALVLIAAHAQLTVDLLLLEQIDNSLALVQLAQVLVDQHLELLELSDRLVDRHSASNNDVLALDQLEEASLWHNANAELDLLGRDLLLESEDGRTVDLDVLEGDWHLLDRGEAVQLGQRFPDEVQVTSGWVQDSTIDLVTSQVRVLSNVEHIDDVLERVEWGGGGLNNGGGWHNDASGATDATTSGLDDLGGLVWVVLTTEWVASNTGDGLDQWGGLLLQNES